MPLKDKSCSLQLLIRAKYVPVFRIIPAHIVYCVYTHCTSHVIAQHEACIGEIKVMFQQDQCLAHQTSQLYMIILGHWPFSH